MSSLELEMLPLGQARRVYVSNEPSLGSPAQAWQDMLMVPSNPNQLAPTTNRMPYYYPAVSRDNAVSFIVLRCAPNEKEDQHPLTSVVPFAARTGKP